MDQSDSALLEPLLYNSQERNVTEVVEKVNPRNAKRIAFILVIVLLLYHSYIHLRYGKDSCRWLLSDGRYKGDMGWQPYGCMMHVYTETDRMRCMKYLAFLGHDNTFAFIGDYKIKDKYRAFVKHFISPQEILSVDRDRVVYDPFYKQSNLTYSDAKLRFKADYIWAPYISKSVVDLVNKWKVSEKPPSIIVMGCATWSIKASNASREVVNDFIANITRLIVPFKEICKKSRVLWVLQGPVNEEKLNATNSMITNAIIDEYNTATITALRSSCVELWSSSRLIAQGQMNEMIEGIELSAEALNTDVQLLLNMYCNDQMNHDDGTCCATIEPYTYIQLTAFFILFVCLVIGTLLQFRPIYINTVQFPNFQIIMTSMAKLAVIVAYFYLCDRTNFFMKENKYYSAVSFWLPLGYIFTLGLFFTEESRFTKIMNRDQTEEWKGWMQLVILIYQMTGAKHQLPIYNHILLLAAAYLFISGFGHFTYLWYRNDAGLIRCLQVLFRINFLTAVLCFCMNRPYQFYYFVPVVTFWFLLFYIVFVLPPRVTASSSESRPVQYAYVLMKIVFLFISISILYMSQVFFEKIFVTRPWKALFVSIDDNIQDWWFRWKIDRFSVLYGSTFAFLLLLAQRYNILDDNNHSNLFSPRVSIFVAILALLGLIATSTYAIMCPNRFEFIDIQTYISIIPIVCYILLRNVSGILRTRFSHVFTFFGRISLELFVSHFHIWLSADSNGVLVLIPRYPVVNALVISYIFVCISYELNDITRKLLPYAVPSNWRFALRNLFIFLILLIPVGIRDGMF